MKTKMMKALKDLNAYIDNDREKLSDRIHELELSHKRKRRLLDLCLLYLNSLSCGGEYRDLLIYRIDEELSLPLRHNWTLKKGVKNG